ncbi:MAG: hypothetical protein M5R36_00055 [Deltaproteobacteria bacterium]|nr:hypothetical protein [Deltaproteobacteria bacterium]
MPLLFGYRGHAEPLRDQYRKLVLHRLIPLAFVCGVAALPLSKAAASSTQSATALMGRNTKTILWNGYDPLPDIDILSVANWFQPFPSTLKITHLRDVLFQTNYVGFGVALLAICSLFSRRRYARMFFPIGVLMLFMAEGPSISWTDGGLVQFSPVYTTAARIIPYIHALEATWELSFAGMFCFAVAAALGLEVVTRGAASVTGVTAAAGITFAVLCEWLFVAPAIVPIPSAETHVPGFYETLRDDPDDYAVFDYPNHYNHSTLSVTVYFYYQTVHQKAIPYSVNQSWVTDNPFWSAVTAYQTGDVGAIVYEPDQIRREVNFLTQYGYRYFTLHRRLIHEGKRPRFSALFEEMFGPPIREDEDLIVYKIPGAGS